MSCCIFTAHFTHLLFLNGFSYDSRPRQTPKNTYVNHWNLSMKKALLKLCYSKSIFFSSYSNICSNLFLKLLHINGSQTLRSLKDLYKKKGDGLFFPSNFHLNSDPISYNLTFRVLESLCQNLCVQALYETG